MKMSCCVSTVTVLVLLIAVQCKMTSGHGRMIDPPSRASMWRYGYNTPTNYDDTAMYCGGYQTLWEVNGGRCGICGDPYNAARDNEAGGKYANGIIVRHYRSGETITVQVELTTSHMGYFEFRICPNNDPTRRATQECLDRFVLRQPDGSTRYQVTSNAQGVRSIQLVLPPGLTCSQCVLQWKYNAANWWGCDGLGPQRNCCIGCGRQEQYYACSDVEITSGGVGPLVPNGNGNTNGYPTVPQRIPTPMPTPEPLTATPLSFIPGVGNVGFYSGCRGITAYDTEYCLNTCRAGRQFCSPTRCTSECQFLQYQSVIGK